MTYKGERDIINANTMISLYCRKKHKTPKGELCEACQSLLNYVAERRVHCPFGDEKPFCSRCKVHCYKPSMRQNIKDVMRFSGPRLLIYNPAAFFRHVFDRRTSPPLKLKTAKSADTSLVQAMEQANINSMENR